MVRTTTTHPRERSRSDTAWMLDVTSFEAGVNRREPSRSASQGRGMPGLDRHAPPLETTSRTTAVRCPARHRLPGASARRASPAAMEVRSGPRGKFVRSTPLLAFDPEQAAPSGSLEVTTAQKPARPGPPNTGRWSSGRRCREAGASGVTLATLPGAARPGRPRPAPRGT